MLGLDQTRCWRRVGYWGVFCLALSAVVTAQTEASAPAEKPAKAATAPTTKAKHSTSGHAAAAHASTHTSTHASSSKSAAAKSRTSHRKKGSKVARKRGQQVIDATRAREIQTALIREHYLNGEPTGVWDSTTQAAMQKYQADQGWQSKTTPDSRALIKLGLGPSHDHLLNPESAMTAPTPTSTPATPAAGDPKAASKQSPNDLPKN